MVTATDDAQGSARPRADARPPAHRGRQAAGRATQRNSLHLTAPLIGTVDLPPTDELAYLGGIAALAVLGLLEWPIAGALAVGHLLASNNRNKVLHDFGEALEEA